MPTRRRTRSRSGNAAGGGAQNEIVVRMYNVGFGDAFLVTIPTSGGPRRILFDCGSIAQGPKPIKDVAAQIIADCTADGVAKIDVVVATHRHKDHVSGFAYDAWDEVVVDEVWMPWTEHPTDPTARRIREAQTGLSLALAGAITSENLNLLNLAAQPDEPAQRLDPIPELALNALSNEAAMQMLHSGFSGSAQRRFLPKVSEKAFTTNVLPGVTIHVLGPSRSEDVIREMDPPQGKSYLRLKQETSQPAASFCVPFSEEFELEGGIPPGYAGIFDASERELVRRGTDFSDFDVAVALDKAVNGTSLMLILEIKGTFLLFPGDAQWGTWNAALADPDWRDLLGKTRFYKIGHHGSHNATPKAFVEDTIGDSIIAMASTKERPIWPNIPRIPLLKALAKKDARIARSDKEDEADGHVFKVDEDNYIETRIPLR